MNSAALPKFQYQQYHANDLDHSERETALGLIFVCFIAVIVAIIGVVLRIGVTLLVSLALDPLGTVVSLFRVVAFATTAIALLSHLMLHADSAISVAVTAGILWFASFIVPTLLKRQDKDGPELVNYES
ncbi:hypothetical protein GSY69_06060 [Brevibacterium sp. 5221]|uniref:Uncharacterized protein n=1 Tax=Brevibacterium rongguiense TaxID=2695267 RepID=A0A6N9H7J4_9MICO|nr:hypothetical protein [Brevibacterium rongguiense]MYM19544.1 hypothetical protein [Brevibacterium rongguiense]